MKTQWLKGITDKQLKEDIRSSFKSSLVTRKRLADMLESKREALERAGVDADGYDCPNWAYKQADAQGYKRALLEIISLIAEK